MLTECSVDAIAPGEKARFWSDAVTSVYFPQTASPHDAQRFSGKLSNWNLGDISLSRINSDAISYRRERAHLRNDREEHLLITFSSRSEIRFEQDRLALTCRANQFFIEMAHLPYLFDQTRDNEIWVLRIAASLLKWHVGAIESFAPYAFDAQHGIGALLFDMMRMAPHRLREADKVDHTRVGHGLVELLALALESDERVLHSRQSSVQSAHLARIERFIRQNLSNPALSPASIAQACGVSLRYLHGLFQPSGASVNDWIRAQRLTACDRDLRRADAKTTIAEIAYRWGFSDHAQFSRHFKTHFGCTPTERRQDTKAGGAADQALPTDPDCFGL